MRETRRHRTWRVGAVAASVGLLAALLAVPTASASTHNPPDAGTTANVGVTGTQPVIECGWALNDTDHDWTSDPKMQYGQDDDPIANPAFPCQPTAGGSATQPNGATMIHVRPNAHDEPTQAWVELWGAVTSNSTNTVVYWDVFHPDGTMKTQVDGTRYANSATPELCDGPAGMWDAAVATGQVASQARTNITNECKFQQKSLWYGAFAISKHQPYGTYRIELLAHNAGGVPVKLTYLIEVVSFYQLEKDFTDVHFGGIGPNDHFWQPVAGDFVWDGINNVFNQKTSVRNTGNAGIGLDVRFHSLCLDSALAGPSVCTQDKRIDQFDVKFGKTLTGLQSMGHTGPNDALRSDLTSNAKPAPPGQWYSFDNDINRVLCPNDVAKIEFSIYTRSIQAGSYSASPGIGLRARPSAICPTDLGSVYNAGPTPTSNSHHVL